MFTVRFEVPYQVYPLEKGAFLVIDEGTKAQTVNNLLTFRSHKHARKFVSNVHNKQVAKLFQFKTGHYAIIMHLDPVNVRSTDVTRLIYDEKKGEFAELLFNNQPYGVAQRLDAVAA